MQPGLARRRTPAIGAPFATLALVGALLAAGCDAIGSGTSAGATIGASTGPVVTRVPQDVPTDPAAAAAIGPWRARGFAVDPTFGMAYEAGCRSASAEIGQTPRVLVDVHGEDRVLVLFAGAARAFLCVASVADPGHPTSVDAIAVPSTPVADDGLDLALYRDVGTGSGTVSYALGRVGSLPTDVITVFVDQSFAFATRGGGWWAMWWHTGLACQAISAVDRAHLVLASISAPCAPGWSPRASSG